jgi:sec-independent protein translocase protein TatA
MFQRLFDSPAQLLILLLIILLLFGASRLPNTARQMGRSMRIFRSEMKEMKQENPKPAKAEDGTDDGAPARDDDVSASRIEALEGRVVDDPPSGATRERSDAERDR